MMVISVFRALCDGKMKSTKVLNPRRCIYHARTRDLRMQYRYAATVNTRASYVGR